MKPIEIKGWIFAKPTWDNSDVTFEFSQYDYEQWSKSDSDSRWGQYRKICEHVITGEAPDLDPRELALAGLESQKTALRAELGRRIAEIDDHISKLTAIEYTPPAADEECEIPF